MLIFYTFLQKQEVLNIPGWETALAGDEKLAAVMELDQAAGSSWNNF